MGVGCAHHNVLSRHTGQLGDGSFGRLCDGFRRIDGIHGVQQEGLIALLESDAGDVQIVFDGLCHSIGGVTACQMDFGEVLGHDAFPTEAYL